ncbi:MAG: Crp/Fnr family transcriptional regulator, partial [Bacteroidota bacterium]
FYFSFVAFDRYMKEDELQIKKAFSHLNQDLLSEIITLGVIKEFPPDTTLLKEGQYVKVIPVVLTGLIKVFSSFEDKELLLYYIRPNESCIMSFAAGLKNDPSTVIAKTEEASKVLLLPSDRVAEWTQKFSDLNTLFFQQYNLRYAELLDTINHLLFNKMDTRVYAFLEKRIALTGHSPIKISHREIASELGTAREVVSRVLKKLEMEGKLKQLPSGIHIP